MTTAVRGLRAMAVVRWMMLLVVAAVAAGTWWTLVLHERAATGALAPSASSEAEVDRFYCPMHPQVRSPHPGNCPICGMTLLPIAERGPGGAPSGTAPAADIAGDKGPEGLATVTLTTERRQLAGVATKAAVRRSVSIGSRLPAVVDVPDSARSDVRTRVPGFVEGVAKVEVGDRVKAGQALVWLTVPEVARALEELRTVRGWKEAPELGAHGLTTGDVEVATKRKLALLGVSSKQADKMAGGDNHAGAITLVAPRDGVVTARAAVSGGYAAPEMALFTVSDLSKLWVRASVATSALDLDALKRADKSAFTSARASYPVTFDIVEPTAAASTRTVTLRFLLDNPDGVLRPGQVGEVALAGVARDELLVPRDAVIDTGKSRYVFVEHEPGVFEPRVVELGGLYGEERAIRTGLSEGEIVVVRGGFILDSESRLQSALAPAKREKGAP